MWVGGAAGSDIDALMQFSGAAPRTRYLDGRGAAGSTETGTLLEVFGCRRGGIDASER
jgi:hypothetical protein